MPCNYSVRRIIYLVGSYYRFSTLKCTNDTHETPRPPAIRVPKRIPSELRNESGTQCALLL